MPWCRPPDAARLSLPPTSATPSLARDHGGAAPHGAGDVGGVASAPDRPFAKRDAERVGLRLCKPLLGNRVNTLGLFSWP